MNGKQKECPDAVRIPSSLDTEVEISDARSSDCEHLHSLVPVELDERALSSYEGHRRMILSDKGLPIHNVGFTGPYGAGKSTLVRSWDKHDDNKYIYISVARFSGENGGDQVTNREVESRLINQLIHKIDPDTVPMSRFRRTANVQKKDVLAVSVGVGLFLGLQLGLSHLLAKSALGPTGTFVAIAAIIVSMILAALAVAYVVRHGLVTRLLAGITFLGIDVTIDDGKKETLFDNYMDDLLYLLDGSNVDVVVFEDLDRYNLISPFESLREINDLANARRESRHAKQLRFFYLVSDSLFADPSDKVKLFDYIVPVIPYVDVHNSYELVLVRLHANEIFPHEECVRRLAAHLHDPRILSQISNEVWQFKDALFVRAGVEKIEDEEADKLVVAVAYKVLFPYDYDCLQHARGFLFTVMGMRKQLAKVLKDEISEELSHCTPEMGDRRDELVVDLTALDEMGITDLIRRYGFNRLIDDLQAEVDAEDNCPFGGTVAHRLSKQELDYVCSSHYYGWLQECIVFGDIDDSYPRFLSSYQNEELSPHDQWFLRSLMGNNPLPPNTEINDPYLVAKMVSADDLKKPSALNYALFSELMLAPHQDKLDVFIERVQRSSEYDFVLGYVSSEHYREDVYPALGDWCGEVVHHSLSRGPHDTNSIRFYQRLCKQLAKQGSLPALREATVLARDLRIYADKTPGVLDITIGQVDVDDVFYVLEKIHFRVGSFAFERANKDLVKKLYEAGLFRCSAKNISELLVRMEGYDIAELEPCMLETVFLLEGSVIKHRVDEEMEGFVRSYVKTGRQFELSEDAVLWVLNRAPENMSNRSCRIFLTHLAGCPINNLGGVHPHRRKLVVQHKKALLNAPNFESLFYAVYRADVVRYAPLSGELLEMIEDGGLSVLLDLSRPECILQAMAATPEIDSGLLNQVSRGYPGAIYRLREGLLADRVAVLVRRGCVQVTSENIYTMRKHYENLVAPFSLTKPDQYASLLLEGIITVGERRVSLFNTEEAKRLVFGDVPLRGAILSALFERVFEISDMGSNPQNAQSVINKYCEPGVSNEDFTSIVSELFNLQATPNVLLPDTLLRDVLMLGRANPDRVLSHQLGVRRKREMVVTRRELFNLLLMAGHSDLVGLRLGETVSLASTEDSFNLAMELCYTGWFQINERLPYSIEVERC